ncbi:MAG: DNA primase, partial [Desulfamplus sp.]|nr:DNA primase [Desulfamplus sp.]
RIFEFSKQLGILPLLEYSGHKGYHFWYFFSQPVDASKVKSFLTRIAEPVNPDISGFDLEVFPKQDKLGSKGFGNLVKLPLGIHRKNGKPSFFMECEKRDVESQLLFLEKIMPADPLIIDKCGQNAFQSRDAKSNEQIVLHPRMAAIAKDYPELFELERLCPPVGQIIAICRESRSLASREEKVLYQTIGFLPRARHLVHHLMASCPDYNPHMVDFRLSRISGTPLGCKKVHSLLGFAGDYCSLERDGTGYLHPLVHLEAWKNMAEKKSPKAMRIENLQDALENMKTAVVQLQRFLG